MRKILFFWFLISTLTVLGQDKCLEIQSLLDEGNLEQAAIEVVNISAGKNVACNNVIGELYLRKGRNDLAQNYFEDALKAASPKTEERAKALNNLGLVFWNMGNSNQASDYINEALDIRRGLYSFDHEKLAASYNDLGLVARDADLALEYYEKAHTIYQKLYGNNHQKVAQAKTNIGVAYRAIEFFGDAQNNFNEALQIWNNIYPNGHPNEGFVYINIGRTYQLMGDLDAAYLNYEKALAVYKKHYGLKHPEVASTFTLIGNIYNTRGEFEQALLSYQQALIANSQDFDNPAIENNPLVNSYFNSSTLLNTLFYKAQALEDLHHNLTLKFKDAKLSLSTLQSADTLIDKMRHISTNEADKLALGEVASKIYENGVRLCHYMGDVSVKKDPFYELSYYFAEKSKSAVLLQAISDASAKSFANIPDLMLQQENELKTEIAYYEQKLAVKTDKVIEKINRQKLFEFRQRYENFISELEEKYPQYFNLKFNVPIPSVSQIQRTLDENTALISYFIADRTSRIYSFQLTKSKLKVENIAQTENFNRYLSGLRNSIYYQENSTYQLTSKALYEVLFPSSLPKTIKHLIIIPAGRLGTIPFEALLTKSKTTNDNYSNLPYLINDFSISYQYASALYYQQQTTESNNNLQTGAFLCAPVTFKNLDDLPGTTREVNDLQQLLTAKNIQPEVYLEASASEEVLKSKDLSRYKYLHFATHGVVDEYTPSLSRIFLRESSNNDGSLYSGEIYNLNLGADLVTLSACETGLGLVSKGEGIIGLSRALVYAGANNIIVSLWSVADNSTSDLMIDFYTNISDSDYSQALHQAKINMIKGGEYPEPFYWAPFILIGN